MSKSTGANTANNSGEFAPQRKRAVKPVLYSNLFWILQQSLAAIQSVVAIPIEKMSILSDASNSSRILSCEMDNKNNNK